MQWHAWQLQDLLGSMLELWNLMDTPAEEQRRFQGVACNIAASEDEITEPGALSMAFIRNVEAEVVRLETLKECRMKDLVVKKHEELTEIRRRARLPEDDDAAVMVLDAIDSGICQLSTRLNFCSCLRNACVYNTTDCDRLLQMPNGL